MSIVCDMQVIEGDTSIKIGDGAVVYEKTFNTAGRRQGGLAILMLMVQNLTASTTSVDVKINDLVVGRIFPYRYDAVADQLEVASHWFTQIINIGSGVLLDGDNELQLEAVGFPEATGSNAFDDYFVRDVICLFQRDV